MHPIPPHECCDVHLEPPTAERLAPRMGGAVAWEAERTWSFIADRGRPVNDPVALFCFMGLWTVREVGSLVDGLQKVRQGPLLAGQLVWLVHSGRHSRDWHYLRILTEWVYPRNPSAAGRPSVGSPIETESRPKDTHALRRKMVVMSRNDKTTKWRNARMVELSWGFGVEHVLTHIFSIRN